MGLARTLFVEKLHATTVSPFNPCQFVGTEDRVLCAECVYPILVLYSSNPHTLSVCVCVCVYKHEGSRSLSYVAYRV